MSARSIASCAVAIVARVPSPVSSHSCAGYDLRVDRLYGHIKDRKRRGEFLAFLRYVRSLHPEHKRLAIILDNFSPHLI